MPQKLKTVTKANTFFFFFSAVHTACLSLKEQIGSKSQWKCAACGVCSVCSIKSKRKVSE